MPVATFRTALAANATAQVLTDSQWVQAPYAAAIDIGINADATGVLATIQMGSDVVMEEGPVNLGTINVLPKDEEIIAHDVVAQGDRCSIKLRDTSGIARVVLTKLQITPL